MQLFATRLPGSVPTLKPLAISHSLVIRPTVTVSSAARNPLTSPLERFRQRLRVVKVAAVASESEAVVADQDDATTSRAEIIKERARQRASERQTYKWAAVAASVGVTSLAVTAVWYRLQWHMNLQGDFPTADFLCTLLLVFGGVVGMELWAQWAHKALWHDFEPGWALHKSHHEPRIGPFEKNDLFAIINAVPAMGLCLYGFLTPRIMGGVCFGAGLGITLFGIMYVFVHDGLVHKRFPVGPIADLPYLRRVAVAHKLHHSEKYQGVPWGLFLGPYELDSVGAKEELDRLVAESEARAGAKK